MYIDAQYTPSLQVLGNVTEFHRAVKLVINTVSFDKDSTVQVFEANIRCIFPLLLYTEMPTPLQCDKDFCVIWREVYG